MKTEESGGKVIAAPTSPLSLSPSGEDALAEVPAAWSVTGHDGQLRPSGALFSGDLKVAFSVYAAETRRTPWDLFS